MDTRTKIVTIIGCIASSYLDDNIKIELMDFMCELEKKVGI